MSYKVFIDENAHHGDESERWLQGEAESYESALAACHRIIDEFLASNHRAGMTADDLFKLYSLFGEDPFIVPDDGAQRFSGWDYAKRRCAELCG